jgi:hypothetical protein
MELRNPDELDFFFSWLLLLAFCREKNSGVKARRRGNYAGARTLRFTFPFPAAAVRPSFRPPRRLPDMRDRAAGRSVPPTCKEDMGRASFSRALLHMG